jgi:hypothetical protein
MGNAMVAIQMPTTMPSELPTTAPTLPPTTVPTLLPTQQPSQVGVRYTSFCTYNVRVKGRSSIHQHPKATLHMGCCNVIPDAHDGAQWTPNDGTNHATDGAAHSITHTTPLTGGCMTYRNVCYKDNSKCHFQPPDSLRRQLMRWCYGCNPRCPRRHPADFQPRHQPCGPRSCLPYYRHSSPHRWVYDILCIWAYDNENERPSFTSREILRRECMGNALIPDADNDAK